ncbi:bifunctional hydroxymethylpyrimidine kinase/phosphomethylpyrimidine kinase [Dialister micraerophilus]|uniref:bifunctional hydroxymethylpyrimidine kinase/phosphomethylpyrimidine kinase n=1 Tax=Dialister micraerophilus TaxID=309120 RepID=UPI00254F8006|nr:bifunctional hydroxymethylpyrimidine kinase/phosphomethylpyrimidine kinase [Dialister micraerophilus]MDK8285488.1 bifunctional hydroxymethylpyrimidine kinase/phosphomethylpyrimidine kinase [Dialister micraerophilus]
MKKLFTIAGSDSSGGAGIQADLKTFSALGTYGMSCICSITAQNTQGVTDVQNINVKTVISQLEAVYDDIEPDGVKTGMLSTPEITQAVTEFLKKRNKSPLVVDPVMVATTGARLMEEAAIKVYKEELFPISTLITPNIQEAEVLADMEIKTLEDMKIAAKKIMNYKCNAVLIKGGHLINDATDLLYNGERFIEYKGVKYETKNTHGTGCTLSSALAVYLAKGYTLEDSVRKAKKYITNAIENAVNNSVGHGNGPVAHFWNCKSED